VRRNYNGGAGIDKFHGSAQCKDTNRPEEWIGSLVSANNPGMDFIQDEGQAFIFSNHKKSLLKDIFAEDTEFYLGKKYMEGVEFSMGFLFKILDSSMRLHVQAHPTAAFAKEYLNSSYGKLECYYILDVREGTDPYIRLGFQHAPSKAEWKRIIEEQDILAMDHCFEKVPIEIGQVWYIPGGIPHAIGKGITMLEIMEPSDLVVRCEYVRKGIEVPKEARFMGKGLDFCLDIFDYTEYSVEEITKKSLVQPKLIEMNNKFSIERLIGTEITSCFEVNRVKINQKMIYQKLNTPQLGVICNGTLKATTGDQELIFHRGDSLFLAAELNSCVFENMDEELLEICIVSGR
jgi:mannose-6-phosphate isomerase